LSEVNSDALELEMKIPKSKVEQQAQHNDARLYEDDMPAGCDLGVYPGRSKGAGIDAGRGIILPPPGALAYKLHIVLGVCEIR
jgi:hypothetical protein